MKIRTDVDMEKTLLLMKAKGCKDALAVDVRVDDEYEEEMTTGCYGRL